MKRALIYCLIVGIVIAAVYLTTLFFKILDNKHEINTGTRKPFIDIKPPATGMPIDIKEVRTENTFEPFAFESSTLTRKQKEILCNNYRQVRDYKKAAMWCHEVERDRIQREDFGNIKEIEGRRPPTDWGFFDKEGRWHQFGPK